MIRRSAAFTLCAPLLLVLAANVFAPSTVTAAADAVVKIDTDDTLNAARIRASIDIAAPPTVVWSVLTDCDRSLRFIPGLESCRIVKRDTGGKWDVREHSINWSTVMPRVRSVVRNTYETAKRLRFKLVKGDLRVSEGEWKLEPGADGRTTRLSYDAKVAPNFPVPQFMIQQAISTDFPKMLRAIRRESLADVASAQEK